MKLTKAPKKILVEIVVGYQDYGTPNDTRQAIEDLETGRTTPICKWTRKQLLRDIAEGMDECINGCGTFLELDTAYVTDNVSHDLVCKDCLNEQKKAKLHIS